jgi:hypothetical protein
MTAGRVSLTMPFDTRVDPDILYFAMQRRPILTGGDQS